MTECPQADRPFEEPWHAQVFALTVALSEAGHFAWPEWAEVFSAELKAQGATKSLDGSGDYYLAWVAALEKLVTDRALAVAPLLAEMKVLWGDAYATTPHGQPVNPRFPQGL